MILRPITDVIPPQDDKTLLSYLTHDSPKLQYACGIIENVVFVKKTRLAFVCAWPHTFWHTYLVLMATGIDFECIHAGTKPEDRLAAEQRFCDEESGAKIFLTWQNTCAWAVICG
ncbi:hypothetical protein FQN54_000335 [Arachnomyces sp. PD_36]|nr:hypothetical protein FQN54_000335 [Arachnomyces sp. PD_36]